jgi:hypothetical protein
VPDYYYERYPPKAMTDSVARQKELSVTHIVCYERFDAARALLAQ